MLSDRCLSCPVLSVTLLWPNGLTDQGETRHAGKRRPWTHCVRWGPSSPSPKVHSSQFSANICCSQMAAWIKISLGMEVGLGPGDFVLDGDPAPPPQKGGRAPKFSAHVYCAKTAGWIKLVLGMEAGLRPGDCVRWGPSPPP